MIELAHFQLSAAEWGKLYSICQWMGIKVPKETAQLLIPIR